MPTYALLGATGGTGSSILRCLLDEPPKDLTLNIFVRSKSKLVKSFPNLESAAPFRVVITEGTPNDTAALQRCLNGADVIFMCIATNTPKTGNTLAYDTTSSIIHALKTLRQEQSAAYKTPSILYLRSMSLNKTIEEGSFGKSVATFCLWTIYGDLQRGGDLLEATAADTPGLLEFIYVDPPSLHDADGTQRTGHELTLTGPVEAELSYADLGAAFCEIASRRSEFRGKEVGVTATGAVKQTWGTLAGYLLQGARTRIIG